MNLLTTHSRLHKEAAPGSKRRKRRARLPRLRSGGQVSVSADSLDTSGRMSTVDENEEYDVYEATANPLSIDGMETDRYDEYEEYGEYG